MDASGAYGNAGQFPQPETVDGQGHQGVTHRDVELLDRMKRVYDRFTASFEILIRYENEVCGRAFGINLFNSVSFYPVIFIHLVNRKIPLEGSFPIGLEKVSRELDYYGNIALLTSIALAAISWLVNADPTLACIVFTAGFLGKGSAVILTLAADFFNAQPVRVTS